MTQSGHSYQQESQLDGQQIQTWQPRSMTVVGRASLGCSLSRRCQQRLDAELGYLHVAIAPHFQFALNDELVLSLELLEDVVEFSIQ